MKHKIGEIIETLEDSNIKSMFDDKVLTVKKGDRGYLDSRGMIHYLNGEAKGKIRKLDGAEMKGFDYESIAKLVYQRLNAEYNISEILENEGIEGHGFRDVIEDVLSDIF